MNAIIWTTLGIGIVGLGLLLALLIEKIADRYAGDPLPEPGTADQTPDGLRSFHGLTIGDLKEQTNMDQFAPADDRRAEEFEQDFNRYENEQWLL